MVRSDLFLAIALAVGVPLCSAGGETSGRCETAVSAFLRSPDERSLTALRQSGGDGCWAFVGSSNRSLQILGEAAAGGNLSAAEYLASHLGLLDGGNLEDALIAVGQFSERDMEGFLGLARAGTLTNGELSDALTMLPLSMSDSPRAQLVAMQKRRAAVLRVSQKALEGCKAVALAAIDDFLAEIRRSMRSNPDSLLLGSPGVVVSAES